MRETTEFERKFPKFLIADSHEDRVFVIHLHHPRFVGEVVEEYAAAARIEPTFIDPAEDLTVEEMARLMREAGDFYIEEIERGE